MPLHRAAHSAIFTVIALALAAPLWSADSSTASALSPSILTPTDLGALDPNLLEARWLQTASGPALICLAARHDGQVCVLNGIASKAYPSIVIDPQHFGRTIGGKPAFAVAADDQVRFTVGDYQGPAFTAIGDAVHDLPGAPPVTGIAYVAANALESVMVTGATTSAPCTAVEITQSPDGKRFAYVAVLFGAGGKMVVADGVAGPAYQELSKLIFSPDGKHLAYGGCDGKKPELVVDGHVVTTATADGDTMITPYYAKDGRLAYLTSGLGGKGCVTWNGVTGPRYQDISALTFSPDGAHLTYAISVGDDMATVTDGTEGPHHHLVGPVAFSPDGRHQAQWIFPDATSASLAIDGQAGPTYDAASAGPVFSADGNHCAYIALKDYHQVVISDGVEGRQPFQGPPCDLIARTSFDNPPDLTFSPDGKHLAYIGLQGTDRVAIIDGTARSHFRDIRGPVAFSADSKHTAWFARPLTGKRQWLLILDDRAVAAYDHVSPDITRGADGHLVWLAIADKHLWRVDLDLTDPARINVLPTLAIDVSASAASTTTSAAAPTYPAETVAELPKHLYSFDTNEISRTLSNNGGFAAIDGFLNHLSIDDRDIPLSSTNATVANGRAVFTTADYGDLEYSPGDGPGTSLRASQSQLNDILLEGSPLIFTK